MSSACHWFLKVSNLFQHLTPGFEPVFMILELVLIHVQPISAFYLWFSAVVQTISWFYHWFLSNSNLCQESYHCFPSNCTIYFSMSIGLQSLLRIFQQLTVSVHLFFPLPGLVFISFFFRSLSHQLSSLCLCFFHFLCSSIFILFITCFLFGIVFTWSLLWNIVSSILVICNYFIFRFHHISYIYIYIVAPSQVFCFKEIRKLPQEDHQTCDAKSLYQFWHCKCNFAKKYLNYSCKK